MQQHSLNATNSLNHLGAKHRGAMSTHKLQCGLGLGCVGPLFLCNLWEPATRDCRVFPKSLAAFLQNDSLRVLHPESGLVRGYLGNTECRKYDKYSQNRNCQGRVAEFWERALDELNQSQVRIDHTVIRR